MSAKAVTKRRPWPRGARIAIRIALVTAASGATTFVVWFGGLDVPWSFATALAFGTVGVAVATLKFEDQAAWDPPGRETPRGIRLALPLMEESLAACDRLARPAFARTIRAVLINERDDRLARGTIVRQMRALLLAELRAHGVAAAQQTDAAVVAMLGPDALTVLQPNDDNPVTTAVITNCLDAVERLATEPRTQQ